MSANVDPTAIPPFFTPSSASAFSLITSTKTPWGRFGLLCSTDENGKILAIYQGFLDEQNLPGGAGHIVQPLGERNVRQVQSGYFAQGAWISPFDRPSHPSAPFPLRMQTGGLALTTLSGANTISTATTLYNGQIENNLMHGQGILRTPEFCYIGSFKNNLKDGYGTLIDLNLDCIYRGFWENDEREGFGTIEFFNAKPGQEQSYQGEWFLGDRHGRGCIKYASGDAFYGRLNKNEKTYGRLISPSHNIAYLGPFQKGYFHGQGEITYFDAFGTKYSGMFERGRPINFGQYEFTKNGRRIVIKVVWESGSMPPFFRIIPNDD